MKFHTSKLSHFHPTSQAGCNFPPPTVRIAATAAAASASRKRPFSLHVLPPAPHRLRRRHSIVQKYDEWKTFRIDNVVVVVVDAVDFVGTRTFTQSEHFLPIPEPTCRLEQTATSPRCCWRRWRMRKCNLFLIRYSALINNKLINFRELKKTSKVGQERRVEHVWVRLRWCKEKLGKWNFFPSVEE